MYRRAVTTAALTSLSVVMPLMLGGTSASAAPQAPRGCPEVGQVYYDFSSVTTSRRLSNLRSDYMEGGGTINYSTSKTATASASMSSTVSAEAGVVFAKASASLGVTVGASWSSSGTWSYSMKVPSGRTARLVMWHESRRFTVKKTRIVYPCNVSTVYTSAVDAPRAANINVWGLDYL